MIGWLAEFLHTTDGAWAVFWLTISALVVFLPNEVLFPKPSSTWFDDTHELE